MAKVTAPLLSLKATGQFANTMNFAGLNGGTRVYIKRDPKNSGTPQQKQKYAAGAANWQTLTAPEKAAWTATGKPKQLNGWQAFISYWLLLTPIPGGVQWDGGAAIWDGGAAIWQP